jgi:hypothetical protein
MSKILARIRRNLKPISPQERDARWAKIKVIRERSNTINTPTSPTDKTTIGEIK